MRIDKNWLITTTGFLFFSVLVGTPAFGEDNVDKVGNYVVDVERTTPATYSPNVSARQPEALGDIVNSFPSPSSTGGLTFRTGSLWHLSASLLTEMNPDTGVPLSTLGITGDSGNSYGLGYDTLRGLFVVSDLGSDMVHTVDPITGAVQNSFSSPGAGPFGVGYDSIRDGYWIADFDSNTLDLIDAATGTLMSSCPVGVDLMATRIAGASHHAGTDRVLFNSRDLTTTFIINASNCTLADSFPVPNGTSNNGQGITNRPTDSTIYLVNFDDQTIYVVDSGEVLPVELQSFSIK